MYYERITKQLTIAEQLYEDRHSLQAFLLLYDLLRSWHLTKYCSYNVHCDDKNSINGIDESECYNNNNKFYKEYRANNFNKLMEAENNIECPCFPAHLRREEVLVRVHAVEYLLAAKPTYTEYNSARLSEGINIVSVIKEALIEKLRLALRLLQPLFTCEEFELNNKSSNNDINSLNYDSRNECNKFSITQVGNSNSSFINSITVSAVVWQTSPFTLQLPVSSSQNEESKNDEGLEQEYNSNIICKPTRWWNVQIAPALSAVRVPLGLIVRSYILRAKCQTALKELLPHDKISWQSILNNLQDALRWIRLTYSSGTLHHNREDLLDELCERVQSISTNIITCNPPIDITQSRQLNNTQQNEKEEEEEKEGERESVINVNMCEKHNKIHTTSMESEDDCNDDHYSLLEKLRSDVEDKLNIVLERERVYCHTALSLEYCHVMCKRLNELRVKYNKIHASRLHKRKSLEEYREYEETELHTIMKYRTQYKTCLHALCTQASNYKLLKRWIECFSCSSSNEEEMSSHHYKEYVAADNSINERIEKKHNNDVVHETSDVVIRSVLHSGCYSAMCSSNTNKFYSHINKKNSYYEPHYCSRNKEHIRKEYSILRALEEYYHWSVTLLQSCSSHIISSMLDEKKMHRHQYEWNSKHIDEKVNKANIVQDELCVHETISFDHNSEHEELMKKSNQIVYQLQPSKQYCLLHKLCHIESEDNLCFEFDTSIKSELSQYESFTHSLSHITRHALRSYLDLVNDMNWEWLRKHNNEQNYYSFAEKCISDYIHCDSKQFDGLETNSTYHKNDDNNYINNVRVKKNNLEQKQELEKGIQETINGKVEDVLTTIDNTLVAINEMSKSKSPTLSDSSERDETVNKRTTPHVQENGYDEEWIQVITNPYRETQFLLLLKSCTFCTLPSYNISQCNVNDAIQNLWELQQFCSVFRAYTLPLLVEIHILLACLALQLSIRNVEDLESMPTENLQRQSQTTILHHNNESKQSLHNFGQHSSSNSNNINEQVEVYKISNMFRYCSELEQNALCDVGIAFAHLQAAEHILVHKSLYCNYATLVAIQLLKTLSLYLMSNRGEELHVMHISCDKTNSICKQEKEIHSNNNVMETLYSHTNQNKYKHDYEEEEYKNKKHIDNVEKCESEEHSFKRTRWETFVQCTHEEHAHSENFEKINGYEKYEQEKEELLEWQIVYKPIPATRQHRTSTLFSEMLARTTQQYIRHATEQISLRRSTENVYSTNNLHLLSQITSLQEWCIQIEEYQNLFELHESTVALLFHNNFNKSHFSLYHDHKWTSYNVVMLFLLHGLHERDEEMNLNSAHYYFTRAHEFIVSIINQKDKNNSGSTVYRSSGSQYLQLFDRILANSYSSVKEKGQISKENYNFTNDNANKTYNKLQSQIHEMCKHKMLIKLRSILSFDLDNVDPSHNHRT